MSRRSKAKLRAAPRARALADLQAIVERARTQELSVEEHAKVVAAIQTLVAILDELAAEGASVPRLRELLGRLR